MLPIRRRLVGCGDRSKRLAPAVNPEEKMKPSLNLNTTRRGAWCSLVIVDPATRPRALSSSVREWFSIPFSLMGGQGAFNAGSDESLPYCQVRVRQGRQQNN